VWSQNIFHDKINAILSIYSKMRENWRFYLEYLKYNLPLKRIAKIERSGENLTGPAGGRFEDFETHFCIKYGI
jgi:hypothetical protein